MKTSVAIFPFVGRTLPIVRHFNNLQNIYTITCVITWRGSGVVGKDAAFVYNHPSINIPVLDCHNSMSCEWDILLVDCSNIGNKYSAVDEYEFFCKCLDSGKKVIFINNTNELPGCFYRLKKAYPEYVEQLDITTSHHFVSTDDFDYYPLSVPVILVGSLVDLSDSLEVLLSLKEQLEMRGYATSCISANNMGPLVGLYIASHIWSDNTVTEEQKILRLNQLARHIINIEQPNLLLVEAPDAVIKYSDVIPNGFGIQTYMLSQALGLDYFVACVPCDLAFNMFLESVSSGVREKYGIPICAAHISNTLVDSSNVTQDNLPLCVHVSETIVSERLEKNIGGVIPMYDVVSQGAEKLCQHLCTLLQEGG